MAHFNQNADLYPNPTIFPAGTFDAYPVAGLTPATEATSTQMFSISTDPWGSIEGPSLDPPTNPLVPNQSSKHHDRYPSIGV